MPEINEVDDPPPPPPPPPLPPPAAEQLSLDLKALETVPQPGQQALDLGPVQAAPVQEAPPAPPSPEVDGQLSLFSGDESPRQLPLDYGPVADIPEPELHAELESVKAPQVAQFEAGSASTPDVARVESPPVSAATEAGAESAPQVGRVEVDPVSMPAFEAEETTPTRDVGAQSTGSDIPSTMEPLAGAYGSWPRYEEKPGDAVAQTSQLSCVSACGEMLTNGAVTQSELIETLGQPAAVQSLPAALGEGWRAVIVDPVPHAMSIAVEHAPCAVGMYERPESYSHMVVLDGEDASGRLMIRDPQEGGSSYLMDPSDFERCWTGEMVIR